MHTNNYKSLSLSLQLEHLITLFSISKHYHTHPLYITHLSKLLDLVFTPANTPVIELPSTGIHKTTQWRCSPNNPPLSVFTKQPSFREKIYIGFHNPKIILQLELINDEISLRVNLFHWYSAYFWDKESSFTIFVIVERKVMSNLLPFREIESDEWSMPKKLKMKRSCRERNLGEGEKLGRKKHAKERNK